MSDDIIPDGDEWDRPAEYQFTAPLRMVEMLRSDLNNDVSFLSLNHFAILLIIFEMEDERFGIEAQTIHSLAAVEKSTANRIVHSLSDKGRGREGLGYIRVETDVNDRRIRRIFLTDKGRFLKQQMATAGTELDNAEVTSMHQAYDSTRMQSMEKAFEPTQNAKVVKKMRFNVKASKASGTTYKRNNDYLKDKLALDRSVKIAMAKGFDWVRFQGKDVPLVSAEEIRNEKASRGDDVTLFKLDGYWMLIRTERLERGNLNPECIQRNLVTDTELLSYRDKLMTGMANGISFSNIMANAAQELNQTEYNRLRNRMTKDLADTRDILMRDTVTKAVEIEKLENVAGGLQSAAVRNRQQAGEQFQHAEKMTKQSMSYPVHMLNEKMDLIASVSRSSREAKEQVELADKLEADADGMVKEAEQLRKEKRAMQKALDDNASAMADMQAMMKQMMDKGD